MVVVLFSVHLDVSCFFYRLQFPGDFYKRQAKGNSEKLLALLFVGMAFLPLFLQSNDHFFHSVDSTGTISIALFSSEDFLEKKIREGI